MTRAPVVLAVLLIAIAPLALAYPDPDAAPRYFDSACAGEHRKRFVFDYVDALEFRDAEAVEGASCDLYRNTTAHAVLVAVATTDGEPIEPYALHLFERWGIGRADAHDGLLVLYVRDYNQSGRAAAVRVEVGYGLEGVVNARVANEAIRLMRDAKSGAIAGGATEASATSHALASGATFLLTTLAESYDGGFPARPGTSSGDPPWFFWLIVVALVATVAVGMAVTSNPRRGGWGYHPGSPHWGRGVGRVFTGGGHGGGGGFRIGGGSFGGGRSGGGGGSGGL